MFKLVVALAAVPSKAMVLLLCLFIVCCSHCLLGACARSIFCFAALCVLSSFAIILLGKRELVALLNIIPLLSLFDSPWWSHGLACGTVKHVLNGHSKIGKTKILMTNDSLMKA